MGLKKLHERVKKQQEKVGEKVCCHAEMIIIWNHICIFSYRFLELLARYVSVTS